MSTKLVKTTFENVLIEHDPKYRNCVFVMPSPEIDGLPGGKEYVKMSETHAMLHATSHQSRDDTLVPFAPDTVVWTNDDWVKIPMEPIE